MMKMLFKCQTQTVMSFLGKTVQLKSWKMLYIANKRWELFESVIMRLSFFAEDYLFSVLLTFNTTQVYSKLNR
jgi:hypothetical protein